MTDYSDEYGESGESETETESQDPEEDVTVESDEYWLEDEMLAEVDELVNAGLIGDEDEGTEGEGSEGELLS